MALVPLYGVVEAPVGRLLLTSDGASLTGLFPATHRAIPSLEGHVRRDGFFTGVRDQLLAYFAGRLERFEVELAPRGTPFQRQVWRALLDVPFGATVSYRELATSIGRPSASRAVGFANGKNPISIIVPCHRVIGSNGKLTGYAGGVELKQWLLDHESGVTPSELLPPSVAPSRHPRLSL